MIDYYIVMGFQPLWLETHFVMLHPAEPPVFKLQNRYLLCIFGPLSKIISGLRSVEKISKCKRWKCVQ